MFAQRIEIEPVVEVDPNSLRRSGRIEVSMTLVGFASEEDMDQTVALLAERLREQFRVATMIIGS